MLILARFIMASRARAALVACAGNLLPLVSPAAVALVTLRKGWAEGLLVALWAALPLVTMLHVGGFSSMLMWASLLTVAVVMAAAGALRATSSWQSALMVVVGASAAAALVAGELLTAEVLAFSDSLEEMFAQMRSAGSALIWEATPSMVLGLLAWVMAVSALGSLLLGRWWQALLYNPGGLGQELRALRLNPVLALGLIAGLLICQLGPTGYAAWGNLLGLPLVMNGIALVHYLVAVSPKVGTHWLAVFYVSLVLLSGPLVLLLAGVGFVDALIDLRARIFRRPGDSPDGES